MHCKDIPKEDFSCFYIYVVTFHGILMKNIDTSYFIFCIKNAKSLQKDYDEGIIINKKMSNVNQLTGIKMVQEKPLFKEVVL